MLERTQNASVVSYVDVSAISKLFNRPVEGTMHTNASNTSFASGIDYTNSRFHNTLIGRNDTTVVVSETLRAQNEKRAFEKAKEEELKRNI
mmetsp:Transcript_7464/g.10587  ORF Transcript_7464/g.10587 Transcript_7464/m.10587 type:complete len:91 (+) Transcript_7464:682-954(+)